MLICPDKWVTTKEERVRGNTYEHSEGFAGVSFHPPTWVGGGVVCKITIGHLSYIQIYK